MGLLSRLNLMNICSLVVVVLVLLSLFWSGVIINQAVDRQSYARTVKTHISKMQSQVVGMEPNNPFDQQRWARLSQELNQILTAVPNLKPEQLTMQNSIVAQANSLKVLFSQLTKLDDGQPIKAHLLKRLLLQVELIQEDSMQLAAMSEQEIKQAFERQANMIAWFLILGLALLLFSTRQVSKAVKSSIFEIQAGIDSIRSGRYEQINLSHKSSEFSSFVKEFNYMSEQLKKTTVTRDVLQQVVDERTEVLQKLADTDTLTQVANRRALYERGEMEFERAKRQNESLSLLMLDCDLFKAINDNFGHLTGDLVLVHLCRICEKQIRNIDFIARFGGEEFVVLLPSCDQKDALETAKRIQKALANSPYAKDSSSINLTVSIGISSLQPHHQTFENFLDDADSALLCAKANGRNRVELSDNKALG
jgi:diguanylate cyclase (GGDEF)-like protein